MQKFMLGCFFGVISIAIATTTSVTSVKAQTSTSATNTSQSMTTAEYIDNTTPQVIEKISGNIVTFKNAAGASNNYFVPSWMLERYNLKVGSSATLYNRNVTQGIYRDRYVDVISQNLLNNMSVLIQETDQEAESRCTGAETEGLGVGMRVWYRGGDCLSTIPVVGAMTFDDGSRSNMMSQDTMRMNRSSDASTQEMVRQDTIRVNRSSDASTQEMVRQDTMRIDRSSDASTQEMVRQDTMRTEPVRGLW